jgi:hypothetical protein
MPDGTLLFAQGTTVQTINHVTGLKVAGTPPLPVQTSWECERISQFKHDCNNQFNCLRCKLQPLAVQLPGAPESRTV